MDICAHLEQQHHIFFTTQQKAAMETVFGPVLLLAVPGAGKTTVLVSRVANMIANYAINPKQILTMTFNREAAADLSRKFKALFEERIPIPPRFSTIHSFCYQVLKVYTEQRGKQLPVLLESTPLKYPLLGEIYQTVSGKKISDDVYEQLTQTISYVKNRRITGEELQRYSQDWCEIERFPEIFKAYEEQKRRKNIFDYDDMLTYTLTVFHRYPELCKAFSRRYPYLHVDEVQDISKIQYQILQMLAGENVFLVGDEDQSIYGFRGAYPEAMREFSQRYPSCKVLRIEENFRSTQEIVKKAGAFIQQNLDRFPKEMKTSRKQGEAVKYTTLATPAEQYSYIYNRVLAMPQEQTMAVLFRNNDSGIPLVDLLERKKIPFYIRECTVSLRNHFLVTDIQQFLRLSQDPSDIDAFLRIYYRMGGYISKKTAQFVQQNCAQGKNVFDLVLLDQKEEKRNTARIQFLRQTIAQLKEKAPAMMLRTILEDLEYWKYLEYRCKKGYQLEILTQKTEALQSIALFCKTNEEFFNRLEELESIIQAHSKEKNRSLTLSTVHSSKGLEFDEVILMDLVEGHFPSAKSIEEKLRGQPDGLEEEARLFYVAVTRARDCLELISAAYAEGKPLSPSRFINRFLLKSEQASSQREKQSAFQVGDRVCHKFFSEGTVYRVDRDQIEVEFDKYGRKSLDAAFCLQKNFFYKL